MQMSTHVYEALANSSCIWECVSCGLPNFSSSLFESSTIQTTNYFWPLDSNLSDGSHSESILNQPQSRPQYSSTPSQITNRQHSVDIGDTLKLKLRCQLKGNYLC